MPDPIKEDTRLVVQNDAEMRNVIEYMRRVGMPEGWLDIQFEESPNTTGSSREMYIVRDSAAQSFDQWMDTRSLNMQMLLSAAGGQEVAVPAVEAPTVEAPAAEAPAPEASASDAVQDIVTADIPAEVTGFPAQAPASGTGPVTVPVGEFASHEQARAFIDEMAAQGLPGDVTFSAAALEGNRVGLALMHAPNNTSLQAWLAAQGKTLDQAVQAATVLAIQATTPAREPAAPAATPAASAAAAAPVEVPAAPAPTAPAQGAAPAATQPGPVAPVQGAAPTAAPVATAPAPEPVVMVNPVTPDVAAAPAGIPTIEAARAEDEAARAAAAAAAAAAVPAPAPAPAPAASAAAADANPRSAEEGTAVQRQLRDYYADHGYAGITTQQVGEALALSNREYQEGRAVGRQEPAASFASYLERIGITPQVAAEANAAVAGSGLVPDPVPVDIALEGAPSPTRAAPDRAPIARGAAPQAHADLPVVAPRPVVAHASSGRGPQPGF